MSDAEQSQVVDSNESTVEVKEVDVDYKSLYEETVKKLDTVAAHKDKLYQETKKAKAEREAAEAEKQKIAQETAKKNGEYEKLWKQAAEEKEQLAQSIHQLKKSYRDEKLDVTAMRIATELADGNNAQLLKTFVKQNLDSLAEEDGSLSEDVVKAVTNEYKTNEMYRALLRGSKASGGGAPGNLRGAAETGKEMTRADFDSLPDHKRVEFFRSGGKLI